MRDGTTRVNNTPASTADSGLDGDEFSLPDLPYALDALEPYLSSASLRMHHGQYHRSCVETLNKIVAGTAYAGIPLVDLIQRAVSIPGKAALFTNAAQCRNHDLFWRSMRPGGGKGPTGRLREMIDDAFGSFASFKSAFTVAGLGQLGSGWVWLVQEEHRVRIVRTANADTPEAHRRHVLLACDLWEHAYCIDYQHRRADFVNAFLDHLANWDFASQRLQ